MAITFPNSPSSGDTHTTSNGLQYTYDGEKWTTIGTNSAGTWTRSGTTVSLTTAGDDLNVDSGTLFVDASTNNIGVGAASPDCKLEIKAAGDSTETTFKITDNSDAQHIEIGKEGSSGFAIKSTLDLRLDADYDNNTSAGGSNIVFRTDATERMRVDSSGRLLLGTTNAVAFGSRQVLAVANGTTGGVISLYNSTTATANTRISSNPTGSEINDIGIHAASTNGSIIAYTNNDTERLRIDSSGNVGVGITSPQTRFHSSGTTNGAQATFGITSSGLKISTFQKTGNDAGVILDAQESTNGTLAFNTRGSERMRIDSSGNVGIGTTSPSQLLTVAGVARFENFIEFAGSISTPGTAAAIYRPADNNLAFSTASTERLRIDSSGRVGIGVAPSTFDGNGDNLVISSSGATGITIDATSSTNSSIHFADGSTGSEAYRGYLVYSHSSDAMLFATSATERMRIDSSGNCLFGTTTNGSTATGTVIRPFGETLMTRSSGPSLLINRTSSDGGLIDFRQDNTSEGSINVSGSTVSLIGAHLSRWSQLANGAARTEILRGSVLSNLDEMCEWGEEDNEQLNRMKVSDVEGDKNVSGVFQAWDDDDDTYTNDFYCAMTGDFVIRIAQGTTVARGDLLMSAGDGTAKPQDDDIVRSKTIAKVTSTIVSTTYSDNSYCVPCVLMAC
jgi:hypothetical protein